MFEITIKITEQDMQDINEMVADKIIDKIFDSIRFNSGLDWHNHMVTVSEDAKKEAAEMLAEKVSRDVLEKLSGRAEEKLDKKIQALVKTGLEDRVVRRVEQRIGSMVKEEIRKTLRGI